MRVFAILIAILVVYLPLASSLNERPGADAILRGPFIRYETTNAFVVYPVVSGSTPDDKDHVEQSTLQLYEDGKPLGPAHSANGDVMAIGRGHYSYRRTHVTMLLFSTSDNSDPNTNGRTYSMADPAALDPYRAQRRRKSQ